jgi:hypothetical protein
MVVRYRKSSFENEQTAQCSGEANGGKVSKYILSLRKPMRNGTELIDYTDGEEVFEAYVSIPNGITGESQLSS